MKKFSVVMDGYDNCSCSICFRIGKVAKIEYYTQNYGSNKRKGKICKNLQKHPHSIWICEKCISLKLPPSSRRVRRASDG